MEFEHQFERFSGAWGLKDFKSKKSDTIQGVDYTEINVPRMYADAWSVSGATLSDKIPATDKEGPFYNPHRTYPTTLVFCGGPNARKPSKGTAETSSMRLTYSPEANRDRGFLEAGAAWAVYAALYRSAEDGCDVVLIPFVSGGLYAGPWRSEPDLLDTFTQNIERMLMKGIMPDGTRVPKLARCFKKVNIVVLKK